MNTTHSISSYSLLEAGTYTVIGGNYSSRCDEDKRRISIILIGRRKRFFQRAFIAELDKIGAEQLICIDNGPADSEMEVLCRKYERLRFLVFAEKTSTGARLNVAFHESPTKYLFVLQANMKLEPREISSRVFTRISQKDRLCTVPIFSDPGGEILPTIVGPMPTAKGHFETQNRLPGEQKCATLLPWDYSGIYMKEKHIALGGFDAAIRESWWQKLEYGLRAWLWGEEIQIHPAFLLHYDDCIIPEDVSPGNSYKRLFLKIHAVRYYKNEGHFPNWFIRLISNMHTLSANRVLISEIHRWVKENRHRYVQDLRKLTNDWNWSN